MKLLFAFVAPFIFLIALGAYSTPPGNEIKICGPENLRPAVVSVNRLLADEGLTLTLTDQAEGADVEVIFVDPADIPDDALATAYPYRGGIKISRAVHEQLDMILLHELIHCGGIDHEDPTSIMRETAVSGLQVKPRHIEALRRLPGITTLGRQVAQWRMFFD